MSFEDYGLTGRQHREPDAHEQEHDVDPLDHADALQEESDWISWRAADHEPWLLSQPLDDGLPVFGPVEDVLEAVEPERRRL